MIEGKMVKIRFKKYFAEQRQWVFVGKVLQHENGWIMVDGKGIIAAKAEPSLGHVDEEPRVLIIPRENIAHIRILPDTFTVDQITLVNRGFRQYIRVKDGPDTSVGEV